MNTAKRKALEAAGWKIGDAADFLGMNHDERQLMEVRLQLAVAIRRQRRARRLSQAKFAARLKVRPSYVAQLECAALEISLDDLVRAFAIAGGTTVVEYDATA